MRLRFGLRASLRAVFADAARQGSPERSTPLGGRSSAPPPVRNKAVVFRILFDEHLPRVRRHLSCFLDDRDEVDEIVADVFVVAWKKLKPEHPMGITWLLRTADNKLRDAARRDRSRQRAIDALTRGLRDDSESLHPLETLALREALIALNARERQVIVLTYWDGLSAGEVSEVLRCNPAAVWTTLTRARTKLRTQLDAKEGEA